MPGDCSLLVNYKHGKPRPHLQEPVDPLMLSSRQSHPTRHSSTAIRNTYFTLFVDLLLRGL
jgi:hypothetical protein